MLLLQWLVAVALLLARRMAGPLGGNVERFGIVNAMVLLMALGVGLAARAGVRK